IAFGACLLRPSSTPVKIIQAKRQQVAGRQSRGLMHQPTALVNSSLALLTEAHRLVAVESDPHPGRRVALGANHRHRGASDRPYFFQNTALRVGAVPTLFDVALDQAYPFHRHPVRGAVNLEDLPAFARFALVRSLGARDDLDRVPDLEFLHCPLAFFVLEAPLEHFRREGDDLHELSRAKLAGDRTEDSGPDRL